MFPFDLILLILLFVAELLMTILLGISYKLVRPLLVELIRKEDEKE